MDNFTRYFNSTNRKGLVEIKPKLSRIRIVKYYDIKHIFYLNHFRDTSNIDLIPNKPYIYTVKLAYNDPSGQHTLYAMLDVYKHLEFTAYSYKESFIILYKHF